MAVSLGNKLAFQVPAHPALPGFTRSHSTLMGTEGTLYPVPIQFSIVQGGLHFHLQVTEYAGTGGQKT